ncbi:hypothetical protein MSAN_01692000 [Mycena sanguinolenta]|uniref:Uncharacterized protein n=1 Tax=Mycena sanguinolenta TaxID=230812 RepID=A0A8H6Y0Q1_9AGAR|nr:hypothetical protein MSAN_01692000 [Mycena sanguinolenta]
MSSTIVATLNTLPPTPTQNREVSPVETVWSGETDDLTLWFLGSEGLMTPHLDYLLKKRKVWEHRIQGGRGEYPILVARGFEAIVQYLACIAATGAVLRILADMTRIYWTVDGSMEVYEHWWEAESSWLCVGDPRGVVFATAHLHEAEERIRLVLQDVIADDYVDDSKMMEETFGNDNDDD